MNRDKANRALQRGRFDALADVYEPQYGDNEILRIYELTSQVGLKAATRRYKEVFGRSHKDKSIDREIADQLADWLYQHYDTDEHGRATHRLQPFRVRPELVLALTLREGWAGRGRGRGGLEERPMLALAAHYQYRRLKAAWCEALIAGTGKDRSWAADEADAEALTAVCQWSGLTKESVLRPRRRKRGK